MDLSLFKSHVNPEYPVVLAIWKLKKWNRMRAVRDVSWARDVAWAPAASARRPVRPAVRPVAPGKAAGTISPSGPLTMETGRGTGAESSSGTSTSRSVSISTTCSRNRVAGP